MNLNKKLSFIGFAVIIIAFFAVNGAIEGSALSPNELHVDEENKVHAPYYEQRDPYFCGEASVQMALYAIQGVPVSQFRLADEMGFIEGAGTRNFNLIRPFEERGVEILRSGPFCSREYLRGAVDNGQLSIINIRFDEESGSAHYVVVVGYNASGFFLHDPWPEEWREPVGRESGENVYVGDELLGRLWAFRLNWVLSVAGPDSVVARVEVVEEWS
jgi:hypothetical protein